MRRLWRMCQTGLLALCFVCCFSLTAFAEGISYGENAQTGYRVVIEDEADLLTDEQERELAQEMYPITAYGGVCFYTLQENKRSAQQAAQQAFLRYFGNDSAVLFLIDMDNRKIWMSANGALYKVVTSRYCSTITDNVYTYASRQDYYGCASHAFAQVQALLEGQRIAQPMKHITNLLLSVILAVLINFGFLSWQTKKWSRSAYGTDEGSAGEVEVVDLQIVKTGTKKTYSPVSDSSSGRSSGRSSGGGGGGFSGGGGGHSF